MGSVRYLSTEELVQIYERTKTIAVVGASANGAKAANAIPSYLQSQGYRIVPVNPRGGEIFGEPVYTNLRDVDLPVDVVEVFRLQKRLRLWPSKRSRRVSAFSGSSQVRTPMRLPISLLTRV
jgi:predicted CoA-binding protein